MLDSSAAAECKPSEAHKSVQLVSAVRANATGLPAYDNGKKISQKRAKQLFPGAGVQAIMRRCKNTVLNWRFHQEVRALDFDVDKEILEQQCQDLLKKHPDHLKTDFLLPADVETLAERVKKALTSEDSEDNKNMSETWVTLSTWARDLALQDGSGIVIPESWLRSEESEFWATRFFMNRGWKTPLDWRLVTPDAKPGTVTKYVAMAANSDDDKEQCPVKIVDPCPVQPTAATGKKKRSSAPMGPLLDFTNMSEPQVPVMPEESNPEKMARLDTLEHNASVMTTGLP